MLFDRLLALGQGFQRYAYAVQITPAFFGQAHAAGGTGEQADAQPGFQAFEGDTGRCGREVKATRGCREAACVSGAHKHFKVKG